MLGRPRLQLPHHVRFGRDQEIGRSHKCRVLYHRLGAANEVGMFQDIRGAFRMGDRLAIR